MSKSIAAASQPQPGISLQALSDAAVPLGVLAIVIAMVTPLPAVLLDLLISADILLSIVVLMVSMHITRPVDFSTFPTTLLLLTLFRLALNISSSRLILLNGNSGTGAAGHVIEAFGNFVVGGNYVIGVVIFLVLIAIQYVVINHGAVRISEVTARFTLDALPGKQMSIDADLNAGLIDEAEARSRRKQLAAEAEFYGAMDGATRFTQRDAVASILITAINILAGFLIGVFQHGMDLQRALQTYTVLTIGDGLVTVIPALMISVAGGLIVTRAGSDKKMGEEFNRQLFSNWEPLALSGGVLMLLATFPGLPTIPFLTLGGGVAAAAWKMRKKLLQPAAVATTTQASTGAVKDDFDALMRVDPLSIEVGVGLAYLAAGGANSPLLLKISAIRRHFAQTLGFVFPPVRVTDNVSLRAREYVMQLKGGEVGRYELQPGCDLAVPNAKAQPIEGQATREPAFGMNALWVRSESVELARRSGYTVVDPVNVLGTHLTELVRRNAHEIFSRQDAKAFCDRVAQESPKTVEDLVPKLLALASVQKVLQNLLRESVSIRDGVSILEALGEAAPTTKNTTLLTEYVRQNIRRTLVKPYLSANGELRVLFTDMSVEQMVENAVEHGEQHSVAALAPQSMRDIVSKIQQKVERPEIPVVVVTSAGARPFLRQLVEPVLPNIFFLSHNEVPAGVRIVSAGVIQ